jgi:GNAT superfamily N-acetyltransferase
MVLPDPGRDLPPACAWCRDPAMAEPVAAFFVAHVDPSYISHSELQFGRAVAGDRWADDLAVRMRGEAARAITEPDRPARRCLALMRRGGELRGLAFVSFDDAAPRPFATLDDLVIDRDTRGAGDGRALLDWVAAQCRAAGFSRLFLESGLDNARAHHFFERQGFVQTSIVMVRDL